MRERERERERERGGGGETVVFRYYHVIMAWCSPHT